jgi:hypothetical protein
MKKAVWRGASTGGDWDPVDRRDGKGGANPRRELVERYGRDKSRLIDVGLTRLTGSTAKGAR